MPRLVAAVKGGNLVLVAPPGAGKTTRLPPALLAAGVAGERRRIVMLEPRRVAARAAARRIATEQGWELGGEVGYQVRFERVAGPGTRLLIVTEGVLVRQLQTDPFLDGVAALLFDELHERSLEVDLALAMARRTQRQARPDLRLVAMSATLDAGPVAQHLDAVVERIEVRAHPVALRYLERPDPRPLPALAAWGVRQALAATEGGVLVFLPGAGEIERTAALLAPANGRREARASEKWTTWHEGAEVPVIPLHGSLGDAAQDAALRPQPRRRIVLATNLAETSLTVPGITAVVDTGAARVLRLDPGCELDRLELTRISRAAAEQRAGRAGREGPGSCLRLWTEAEHGTRPAREEPEVARVDLAGAVLQLRAWGEGDLVAFPWLEAPPAEALWRAERLLRDLGAVDDGGLTGDGAAMAKLPLHPRLARLVLEGRRGGYLEQAALVAALLAERDPFRRGEGSAGAPVPPCESDALARAELVLAAGRAGRKLSTPYGELSPAAARRLLQARDQVVAHTRRELVPDGRGQAPPLHRSPNGANTASVVPAPSSVGAGLAPARPAQRKSASEATTTDVAPAPSGVGAGPVPARPAPSTPHAQTPTDVVPGLSGVGAGLAPAPPVSSTPLDEASALGRALLAAFPDRLARRRATGEERGVMVGGRGVALGRESGVRRPALFLCLDLDAGRRGERAEARVRVASGVELAWLPPSELSIAEDVAYDPTRDRVIAWRRARWRDLVVDEAEVPVRDDAAAAAALATAASADVVHALGLDEEPAASFLTRVRCLRDWRPELGLPPLDESELSCLVPMLAAGRRSLAELRRAPALDALRGLLTASQLATLERDAPERLEVPSGNRVRLRYEEGRPPILAARIQELFGLAETPRLAGGRVPVLLHLLAPNQRPQQVTDDLASFWRVTYPQVRKELRARYPRHAWPEDPTTAPPQRRPRRPGS